MSAKEVTALRKAGKLEDAYKLAQELLATDNSNVWNKRAMAWVLFDLFKIEAQKNNHNAVIENLKQVKAFDFSADEKMLFNSYAWQIGKYVGTLKKQKNIAWNNISEIFEIIKDFKFEKPSDAYCFIYKSFHKEYLQWEKFLDFADWWDFNHFTPEDYSPFTPDKGKPIMSIAEQAYIAYPKVLIKEKNSLSDFKGKAESFIKRLDIISNKHPEYKYTLYSKAKLLVELGDKEKVSIEYLPFARKNSAQFWTWTVLADFYDDENIKIACLCKALNCKSPREYLVNVRKSLAVLLIKQGLYNEAAFEIKQINEVKLDQNWKISNVLNEWMATDWFKNATHIENNYPFYKKHIHKAEKLIYSDIPEDIAIVDFVNKSKKVLNFITTDQKFGFFKYERFFKNVKEGDRIDIRLGEKRDNGFYNILTAYISKNDLPDALLKDVEGVLKIFEGKDFGILNNTFVPPYIVHKYKLENGNRINGKAVLSYNRKKEEVSWKLLKVDSNI